MSRDVAVSASIVGVLSRRPAASSPSTMPRSTVTPPPNEIIVSSPTRSAEPPSNRSLRPAALEGAHAIVFEEPAAVGERDPVDGAAAQDVDLAADAPAPSRRAPARPTPQPSPAGVTRRQQRDNRHALARCARRPLYTVDIGCAEVQIKRMANGAAPRTARRQADQVHLRDRRRRLARSARASPRRRSARCWRTAASRSRSMKLDPYINVDPGHDEPVPARRGVRHRRRRRDRSRPRPLRALHLARG